MARFARRADTSVLMCFRSSFFVARYFFQALSSSRRVVIMFGWHLAACITGALSNGAFPRFIALPMATARSRMGVSGAAIAASIQVFVDSEVSLFVAWCLFSFLSGCGYIVAGIGAGVIRD